MINETIKNILLEDKGSIVTPIDNVSICFANNTLLHAIMLLNNTSFTSIPVLDYDNTFKGLISTSQIFKFLGQEINQGFQVLEKYKIKDAIDTNYYTVAEDFDLEEVVRALINHNFLCVVDKEGKLKGLIPRSNLLKRFNFLVHEFDKNYIVKEKNYKFLRSNYLPRDMKKASNN
ncbi:MAG: cyclic-di-AMP-binding protein CbpB [Tissierellia bacterium]|nr:cyclic-di-AMP-binding protein CbpB [Tissierellia bacterium]